MGYYSKGKWIEGYWDDINELGSILVKDPSKVLINFHDETITLEDIIQGWMDSNKRYMCLLKELSELKCKGDHNE